MEARREGSSTPSYRKAVASRGKKPLETVRGPSGEGFRIIKEDWDSNTTKENNKNKENEQEEGEQGVNNKAQKGPCKPKAEVTPRVVLNDPAL